MNYSIQSILDQNFSNFELIISDNYSDDETKIIVNKFKDSRIKYINTGKNVSMTENWEFALDNCIGDWITILGDDDALLPDALTKVYKIIRENPTILAIRSETCYYFYPGVNNNKYGKFGIPLRNKSYEIRKTKKWLQNVLFGRYNYTELPVLYNGGFISAKLIENSRINSKKLLNSCIPDVYSSILFSHLIDEYIYSYEPLAINGASLKSNGISQFSNDSKKKESISNLFQKENTIAFNEKIPLYTDGRYPQSIKAFIYESYLNCTQVLNINSAISANKQLQTIIFYDFKSDQYFIEWLKAFSLKNNLSFRKIYLISKFKKIILSPYSFILRISVIGKSLEFGDKSFHISNIYEAYNYYKIVKNLIDSNCKNIIKILFRKIIT